MEHELSIEHPELLEATLFALAHVAGGLGGAIVTVLLRSERKI